MTNLRKVSIPKNNSEEVASEALKWSRYFPYSSAILVGIIALLRPDLGLDMLHAASYHTSLSVTTISIAIPFIILGFCLFAYAIHRIIQYIKQYQENQRIHKERLLKEKRALMEIFKSLNGNLWKDKTRWGSDEPIEKWKGVITDGTTGYVKKLILSENELSGKICEEIGWLADLDEIDFRDNNITGPLPNALTTLSKLAGLYLYNNRLNGKIPDEIGTLPEIMGIYLFNNEFEDIQRTKELFRSKVHPECYIFI